MNAYDKTTIHFHWTTAGLIVALWVIGQTVDWFPRGPARGVAWSTHFTLGAILIAVYVGRIVWRTTSGRRLPGVGSPALVKLASAGHGVLYLGIGLVIALGIANLFAHGSGFWGLFHFPKIADESLRHNIARAHGWGANLLLMLAAAHAAVALFHQYVRRDGVLTRMWPSLAR
jgi:cytochrome b561